MLALMSKPHFKAWKYISVTMIYGQVRDLPCHSLGNRCSQKNLSCNNLIPPSHFIVKDQNVESSLGKVMSAYAGQPDLLMENCKSISLGNMTPQFARVLSETCISESDKKCKLGRTRPHSILVLSLWCSFMPSFPYVLEPNDAV